MSGKLPYSHNNIKKTSSNGADIDTCFSDTGARRLRQIEEILGVCIASDYKEILDHKNMDLISHHEQTIQLINAFELITDPKCRADIVEIVIAAAQREHQLD